MISERMQKAFNDQINKELYSAYLYLAMAAYLENQSLKGMSNWLIIQTQEELEHAKAIFDYVNDRGGKISLEVIEKPPTEFVSVSELFSSVYEHEKYISSLINKLADYAEEESDRAALSFLKWYIDEQVEEESKAYDVLQKVKFVESNAGAMLILDNEMATRTFSSSCVRDCGK